MATVKLQNDKVITKNGNISCSCCEFPITYGPFLNSVSIGQSCFRDGAGHTDPEYLSEAFLELPEKEQCHPQERYRVKTTVTTTAWGSVETNISTYGPCASFPNVEATCDTSGNIVGYEEFDCYDFPTVPPASQTITFSEPFVPFEEPCCSPEELPPFPEFETCNEEPPPLEFGQGRGDFIVYNTPLFPYANNTGLFGTIRWRIEHGPIPTGYLKVWIVIRTQTVTPDENHIYNFPNQCGPALITGAATEEIETYEWTGSDKLFDISDLCSKIIFSEEKDLGADAEISEAGIGQIKTIDILKYSFTVGYEPNDPDEFGGQGDKPNGIEPQT
jgi:hypothetical protein